MADKKVVNSTMCCPPTTAEITYSFFLINFVVGIGWAEAYWLAALVTYWAYWVDKKALLLIVAGAEATKPCF